MATIETEMVRAENELRRQAALAAKRAQQEQAKAAKKTAFKAQCEGKNGKVKAVKPVKVQANPTEADRKADRKARSEFQVSKWKVKS